MLALLDAAASEQRSAAIERNNFAVSQIERGRYGDAIRSLQGALKTCRELIERGGIPEDAFQTSSSPFMAVLNRQIIISREPIRIPLTVESNLRAHVMISAMIISNIALTYHLEYDRSSRQHQSLLDKSTRFFEMALQLIELLGSKQLEEGRVFANAG
jgi:hypothetical protein